MKKFLYRRVYFKGFFYREYFMIWEFYFCLVIIYGIFFFRRGVSLEIVIMLYDIYCVNFSLFVRDEKMKSMLIRIIN